MGKKNVSLCPNHRGVLREGVPLYCRDTSTQVINERDILGTQVIRRNDELALLYEKIKIQQSTLNIGEVQYSQRQEDIRILKLEVRRMRRERASLSKSVSNMDDLR